MWVFSKTGFVSIVKHKYIPGSVMIRARVKADLEQFLAITGKQYKIEETPDADYRFRATATKKVVAEVLTRQINDMDYTNFKNATHSDSAARNSAYMKVWSAMYGLQASELGEGRSWDNDLFFGQEPEASE